MGYSDSEFESKCPKHPTRYPQTGVCPSCLTESLLNLSPYELNFSYKRATMVYSSSCSSSLSYLHYSDSSPVHYSGHNRAASDVLGSVSFFISNGLSKSRSVAGDPGIRTQTWIGNAMRGEKKRGFWSKLFSSTGKTTREVFGHNKVVRGRGEVECYA